MQAPQQIKTIHNYIKYMREMLEFWASSRAKEITEMNSVISSLQMFADKEEEGAGYVLLPGGTLIQWGNGSFEIPPTTETEETITFPIKFKTAPHAVANCRTTRPQQLSIVAKGTTATTLTLSGWNAVSSTTTYNSYYNWIAIGQYGGE